MKKLIFLLAFLVCAVWASAQIMPINAYGYQWKRGYFDTTLRIPTDTIASSPAGSIAYINGVLYVKNASGTWPAITSGATYSAGSGISIASNVISANYGSNIWNANQLQSRGIDLTAPANNQVLTWDSTLALWKPKVAQGGAFQSLTTTGTSGPATLVGGVLNIPTPASGGTVTNVSSNAATGLTGGPITGSGTLAIDTAGTITTHAWHKKGIDSLAAIKQANITLTTTGTSGAATFVGNTLNIPNYASGAGTVTSVATNTGSGITGGTITGSGTLAIDTTSVISTKARAQQIVNDTALVLRSLIGAGGGASTPYHSANFMPTTTVNTNFIVFASGILYPTNTYSNGAAITWGIYDQTTGHAASFFDSVYANPSTNNLVVTYPRVKNVLNFTITPDETIAGSATVMGPTVGDSVAETQVYQPTIIGAKLTGAGTGTWTVSSPGSFNFDIGAYSNTSGLTPFSLFRGYYDRDYSKLAIEYHGPNGYHVKRVYSGLSGKDAGFALVDDFGNGVTDYPTSSDEVTITSGATSAKLVDFKTYAPENAFIGSGVSNLWATGMYELWMVAEPTSSTSVRVRYQPNYSSASGYKIYRSTSRYGTYTLVHSGTSGSFDDTGLSAGTTYYYKEYATIVGVDYYVTYFTVKTTL